MWRMRGDDTEKGKSGMRKAKEERRSARDEDGVEEMVVKMMTGLGILRLWQI